MRGTAASMSCNMYRKTSDLFQPRQPAVGLRFIPTDEELVGYFLLRKILGIPIPETFVLEYDLYGKENPWDIWQRYENRINFNPSDGSEDMFFFTRLKRKKPTALRVERRVGIGAWQGEDGGSSIMSRSAPNVCLGFKKRLRFEKSGTHHDGEWIMHEYSLNTSLLPPNFPPSIVNELVICRIRKNEHHSIDHGNKNGNKRKRPLKCDETHQSSRKLKKSGHEVDLSLTVSNKTEVMSLNDKQRLCSPRVEMEIIGHQQEELMKQSELSVNPKTRKIKDKEQSDNTLFTIDELLSNEHSTEDSDKLDEEALLYAMDLERELFNLPEDLDNKNNDNESYNPEEENLKKVPTDEPFLNGPPNTFSRTFNTFGRISL